MANYSNPEGTIDYSLHAGVMAMINSLNKFKPELLEEFDSLEYDEILKFILARKSTIMFIIPKNEYFIDDQRNVIPIYYKSVESNLDFHVESANFYKSYEGKNDEHIVLFIPHLRLSTIQTLYNFENERSLYLINQFKDWPILKIPPITSFYRNMKIKLFMDRSMSI
jgi:hypothetical protein